MKYLILTLLALAFATGVLGFTLFLGTTAFVFRIAFASLLVAAGVMFFVPNRPAKSRQSTFAESFRLEPPPAVLQGEQRLG